MDDFDKRLLTIMQEEVPLAPRPFEVLARRVQADEAGVISRVEELESRKIIRQISAIFDTRALGYDSSLVAAKIPAERLERAAATISQHPGVTHNYQRNHAYNLWYTLAVPPDSRLGLCKTVEILHGRSGATVTRLFPTLKLYKIGVSFDLAGEGPAQSGPARFTEEQRRQAMAFKVTETDKSMIRVLQQNLPIIARPYEQWARQAGVTEDDLLLAARTYLEQKRMRRFSAVLHHREAGITSNGMGAWAVPTAQQDGFGALAANFAAVSHCYLRPTYEDWPYSIFTMVHGRSEEECNAVLGAISEASGITNYLALYSSREFKKTRLKYFIGDIEQWEQSVD